jgi:predicted GIY-YIG superfamily endonuclease
MNKHQLACQAVLDWDGVAVESKKRMRTGLKQNGSLTANPEEKGSTAGILAKRFNVSKGYILEARRLFKTNQELFQQVLKGSAKLPIVRPTRHQNKDHVSYSLYRVYDSDGVLLYIGKTWNMENRMNDHSRHSKWWNEFSTMTVERNFYDYDSLTKAETMAIRDEQPKYNLEAKWYQ